MSLLLQFIFGLFSLYGVTGVLIHPRWFCLQGQSEFSLCQYANCLLVRDWYGGIPLPVSSNLLCFLNRDGEPQIMKSERLPGPDQLLLDLSNNSAHLSQQLLVEKQSFTFYEEEGFFHRQFILWWAGYQVELSTFLLLSEGLRFEPGQK